MKLETIIFDLGAVLIDWDPRHLYRKVFHSENEMEYFLANVCTSEWNAQQDAGRPFSKAIELKQKEYPNYKEEIHFYYSRWTEMLNGEIKDTVSILEKLYKGRKYRLYALTNWSDETFHHALERYAFLKFFEGIVVSGKEKIKKPDQRIYEIILSRYDISPEDALFIDDSFENVKTARKLKINTHHFKTPSQLLSFLKENNII